MSDPLTLPDLQQLLALAREAKQLRIWHVDGADWPARLEAVCLHAIAQTERAEALQAFKSWVHQYLDAQGVPYHPPGVHGAEGCRIGDRLDWLMARLRKAESDRDGLRAMLDCILAAQDYDDLAERTRDVRKAMGITDDVCKGPASGQGESPAMMKERPRRVCLCGSSRFKDAHIKAMRRETLAGRIVLPMGLYGHVEGLDMTGPVKQMLDELHLAKIDAADEILVIDCLEPRCPACKQWWKPESGGVAPFPVCLCCVGKVEKAPYIGDSTRREIAYAVAQGKKVRYLSQESPPAHRPGTCRQCGGTEWTLIQTEAGSGDRCRTCGRVEGY